MSTSPTNNRRTLHRMTFAAFLVCAIGGAGLGATDISHKPIFAIDGESLLVSILVVLVATMGFSFVAFADNPLAQRHVSYEILILATVAMLIFLFTRYANRILVFLISNSAVIDRWQVPIEEFLRR